MTKKHFGGQNVPLADAAERGFTHVLIAPKGHPVSVHKNEKLAKRALWYVRGMGCKVIPMSEALRASV